MVRFTFLISYFPKHFKRKLDKKLKMTSKLLNILLFQFILCLPVLSQNTKQTTFCNPVDLDYKYGQEIPKKRSNFKNYDVICRSSADPVLIKHSKNGEFDAYYLFPTLSKGYWRSENLIDWKHVSPDQWPVSYISSGAKRGSIAPAALSVNDTMYYMPSNHFVAAPIYFSTDVKNGKWEVYNKSLAYPKDINPSGLWDPALYYDEDTKKWYNYWGSSSAYPIIGAELDKSKNLAIVPKYKELISLDPKNHGWERFGYNHTEEHRPSYIEGAWMTKNNGKYYLQYGAPGTSENMYANGTFVSDQPLGPFEYAANNPISYKPGGFVTGTGHGNTFQDKYGNWWNTGTCWIGVNWVFERRIVMVPAGFDEEDQMYANTRFADFPHYVPQKKWKNSDDLFTGWMLLSYKKPCNSTSSMGEKFSAKNVTDENPRTFWISKQNRPGESVSIDLEQVCEIKAFQINYNDYLEENKEFLPNFDYSKSSVDKYNSKVYTQYKMYASKDGENWITIGDNTHEKINRSNPYIQLEEPVKARYVKFENVHVSTTHLAVGDIRIFGNGNGRTPKTPRKLVVKRDAQDGRNAFVTWEKSKEGVGYNILWGISPDKLYQTYQVWGDVSPELEIRALNLGQEYYFSIEAFNENGVSEESKVVKIL